MKRTIDFEAEQKISQAPETEPARQYYFMEELKKWYREESGRLGRPLTFHVQTFGCQMNAKDSEKLAGILQTIGYEEIETEEADFVLYNTCTVRENANTRVYGRIGYLGRLKRKSNPAMKIALCGCMMQEEHVVKKIRESYSFVDLIFGTHNIYKLAELLYYRIHGPKMVVDILQDTEQIVEELPSDRKFQFKAGVNIMYGCNNFCSYCIVPYVRGRERSRKPEDIIREMQEMAAEGITEVMLLGQNVNSYGRTLPEQVSFAKLLTMAEQVDGIRRIRFMTPHPKDLSDELLEVMKVSRKICHHVHLPLQSGSSRLLKLMNRKYTKEDYLALVSRIRSAMPDAALTTDIIIGFPGETEEDFQETMDVVRQARFTSAYTFLYSPRSKTPAAEMPDQVPDEVARERFNRLLALVQDISAAEALREEGQTMEVLVEEQNSKETSLMTGRLANNLLVHFPGNTDLLGKYVMVHLEKCHGFYYTGSMLA